MSAPTDRRGWQDATRLPDFIDQLEQTGAVPVLELLDDLNEQADFGVEADGVVYHDRGIRVPGYNATFVHEPAGARGRPAWSVEVDTVGPRNTWAKFDDTLSWDVYLLRTQGLAALAWLSDEEYRIEEEEHFPSKDEAVVAGRFSFGIFLHVGESWEEQVERIQSTNAPAYLQSEDGTVHLPQTQSEFYQFVDSTPTSFRTSGGNAPSYLGLLELEVTID